MYHLDWHHPSEGSNYPSFVYIVCVFIKKIVRNTSHLHTHTHTHTQKDAHDANLSKIKLATQVQVLVKEVYNTLCANALRKSTNSSVLLLAMDKLVCLAFDDFQSWSKKALNSKPALLHLKVDLISHLASNRGIGKYTHSRVCVCVLIWFHFCV